MPRDVSTEEALDRWEVRTTAWAAQQAVKAIAQEYADSLPSAVDYRGGLQKAAVILIAAHGLSVDDATRVFEAYADERRPA